MKTKKIQFTATYDFEYDETEHECKTFEDCERADYDNIGRIMNTLEDHCWKVTEMKCLY